MQYDRLTDEQAAARAQGGDDGAMEHLLRKYACVVRYLTKSYFLHGAETEDMVQEGMIGLFKAIRDFRGGRDCSFRTFADVCIRRQMITAVKSNEGQLAFVFAASLDEDAMRRSIVESQPGPERAYEQTDRGVVAQKVLESCSPFERAIVLHYADGTVYLQIAAIMGLDSTAGNARTCKAVDNALCRVRRKAARAEAAMAAGYVRGDAAPNIDGEAN